MTTSLTSATWQTQAKRIAMAITVTSLAACTAAPEPSSSSSSNDSSAVSSEYISSSVSSVSSIPSETNSSFNISEPASSSSEAPSSSSIPEISSSSDAVSSSSAGSQVQSILRSSGTFTNGFELFYKRISADHTAPQSVKITLEGSAKISNPTPSSMSWHTQILHPAENLENGKTYTLCYDAKADDARTIEANIDNNAPDYASVMGGGVKADLTTEFKAFKHTFVASAANTTTRLTFSFADQTPNVELDNIGLFEGSECGVAGPSIAQGNLGKGSQEITSIVPITTSGNQVLFGGKQGSIAGASLFWSNTGWGGEKYYNANVVAELKTKWNAKLVRAAMGVEEDGGYIIDAANQSRVEAIVNAAIANQMYVIIDWHTHHAEDPANKSQAIEFFKKMASKYGDKDNVIYEVYNEPILTSWSAIKSYAVDVIKEIRAIDPDNLIIVGTREFSQHVEEAAADPITGYDNIAYTLHFYSTSHQGDVMTHAVKALDKGIPLFVTEWGVSEANGTGVLDLGAADTWLNFLYDNNISHANWALNDKGADTSSALKLGANANGSWNYSENGDLTESGRYVRDAILTW